MNITQEIITPEQAIDLLGYNSQNRNVRPDVVNRYARDMLANEWTPDSVIKIDEKGILVDGQHRLFAVIEADIPMTFIIVRDVTEEARWTVDTGLKRSFHDMLSMQGERNTTDLATIVRVHWQYHYDQLIANTTPTINELMVHLQNNPGLRDATKFGRSLQHIFRVSAGPVGAALYEFIQRDAGMASSFVAHIRTDVHLATDDPTLAWRRWAGNLKTAGDADKITTFAITIKAWNAFVNGKGLRVLHWRRFGPTAEPFPTIARPL